MRQSTQALLLIDVQVNMFDPDAPVYRASPLLAVLGELAAKARTAQAPILFVRNNGGPGAADQAGTPGWEIHPALAPQPGETVIDKDSPDAFAGTNLEQALASLGVSQVVIAGMQSELCIAATTRRAVELGYQAVVVADGHSSFDDDLSAAEVIEQVNQSLNEVAVVLWSGDVHFDAQG